MADIFLSYTRADAAGAGQLAAELEQRGFSVFWDTEVLPGQRWRDVIHDELVGAACVIVVWSAGSSQSRWVVEEASEALEAGKLLPVLLDGSLPPFGFRGVEAANLSAWTPGSPDPEFENLVNAARRIVSAGTPSRDESPPVPPDVSPRLADGDPSPPPADVSPRSADGDPSPPPADAQPAPGDERPRPAAATLGFDSLPSATPSTPPIDPEGTIPMRSTTPQPEGIVARLGTAGMVAIGAAAVLVIVVLGIIASGDGGDRPTTTVAGGGGGVSTTAGGVSTTTDDVTVTNIVASDTVTAFRAASAPVIDGDLAEWDSTPEGYRLQTEVFRDADVVDRLGDDSPGVVIARYDDAALYLAVVSADDVYSQQNVGNQIWRGDALDINLTTAPAGGISERPDGDDFQLTMTPRAADGGPSAVWFTGSGTAFSDNTTQVPVVLAGEIDADGSWQLEAAIPWSVFGLAGPPPGDIAALIAVFDNDGEVVDGQPQQTVILGHTDAEFQRPLTWGTLTLER